MMLWISQSLRSMKSLKRGCLTAAVSLSLGMMPAGLTNSANAGVITFDDIPVGTEYVGDDIIFEGNGGFLVALHFSSRPESGMYIGDGNPAGGSGNALVMTGSGFNFRPQNSDPRSTYFDAIAFQFGDVTGEFALEINGGRRPQRFEFSHFSELDGLTFSNIGVMEVIEDDQGRGSIFFTGTGIGRLSIDSNEEGSSFTIDNIIFSTPEIPEPATGLLLLMGSTVMLKRKHKRCI